MAVGTAKKTRPSNDKDLLMEILGKIVKGEAPGWKATRSDKGTWTVNTPRRGLRLLPSDAMWDEDKSREHLYKLRAAKLPYDIDLGRDEHYDGGDTKSRNVELTVVPEIVEEPAAPKQPAVVKKVGPKAKAAPTPAPAPVAPANAKRLPDPVSLSYLPVVDPSEGEVAYEIDVTPDMARELRERKWEAVMSDGTVLVQRKLDEDNVMFFIELIRTGAWQLTHQGVAIGINGSVYDGQHRLEAIARVGKTVRVRMTFNTHPDKIPAFDGGKGRTTATKLAMANYKHSTALSAAVKQILNYLEWEEVCKLGEEAKKELGKTWRKWHGVKYQFFKIDAGVRAHPELPEHIDWATKTGRRGKGFPASVVGAFRYLALRAWPEGEELLQKYLLAVIDGIGIDSHDHVAKAVQLYIEKAQDSKRKEHFYAEEQLHVLIKGWDLFARDKRITQIRPGALPEDFPLLYQPKGRKKA